MRAIWLNTQKSQATELFLKTLQINALNYINQTIGTSLTLMCWQLNFNNSPKTLDIKVFGDTSSYQFTQEKRHAGKHNQHPEVPVDQGIPPTPGG